MWHLYSRLFFDPIEGLFCRLKYQFSHSKWQSWIIAHLLFSFTDGHTDQVIALETLLFTLFVAAKICKKEKAKSNFYVTQSRRSSTTRTTLWTHCEPIKKAPRVWELIWLDALLGRGGYSVDAHLVVLIAFFLFLHLQTIAFCSEIIT